MALKLTKHERVLLRDLAEFSEAWLHGQISDDPTMLGLGEDLNVLDRERIQHGAGRLDLLLADDERSVRYEVEIMLGSTDASHIIRCIEYWDIERRRYPAYDHVAVLVAEDITSRFINEMSLLAGSIPLVAIQINALKVGDQVVFDFVKVLDQRELRVDDTLETSGERADRSTWESRKGNETLKMCDRVAEIANEIAEPKLELKYQKSRVGLCPHGSFFNVAAMWPKKGFLPIRMGITDAESWLKKLQDAEVEAESTKPGRITLRLRAAELSTHESLLRELIHQAVREFQSEK